MLREMKTTAQETRARRGIEADAKELATYGFKSTSRRSKVPSSWDDINREDQSRNWKTYRRTKWR